MSPRVMPENRIPDIIRAAAHVFSLKGYRLTQMEEIAKEAGISKATLYYYFKSKAHLFHYVLENGVPEDSDTFDPSDTSFSGGEDELLEAIKKRLKKGSRFKSIGRILDRKTGETDMEDEIAEILDEWWDMCEKNSVSITILEKSLPEFPELAEVFDRHARQHILSQLEKYLSSRMQLGMICRLNSVPAVARLILESVAWFGWKQRGYTLTPLHSKSEVLPDIISIFTKGLKR